GAPKENITDADVQARRSSYPKLAALKNAALLSDITSAEDRVAGGHKKGINVLYNNGSARWVDISNKFAFGSGLNYTIKQMIDSFGTGGDPQQIQLWFTLDQ